MKLSQTLGHLARRTWKLLAQGRANAIQLGEETLTDLNLLHLKAGHPHEVRTHIFKKHAERRTGADWEWWFAGASGKWFGMRVQAKVLDVHSNSFRHLHYGPKHSCKTQCDYLIESCSATKPSPVPAYCFYSQWQPESIKPDLLSRGGGCAVEFYGCALATAGVVLALRGGRGRRKQFDLAQVIPHVVPWHLLVCREQNNELDLATRVCRAWTEEAMAGERRLLNSLDELRRNEIQQKLQVLGQTCVWGAAPDYISAIENAVEPEFPPPVRRIIVIKELNN